jgi:hypothetical protein
MTKKVILGKKCVYDIEKKEKKYEHKLNFDYYIEKWFMDFHGFCWCLILFIV